MKHFVRTNCNNNCGFQSLSLQIQPNGFVKGTFSKICLSPKLLHFLSWCEITRSRSIHLQKGSSWSRPTWLFFTNSGGKKRWRKIFELSTSKFSKCVNLWFFGDIVLFFFRQTDLSPSMTSFLEKSTVMFEVLFVVFLFFFNTLFCLGESLELPRSS